MTATPRSTSRPRRVWAIAAVSTAVALAVGLAFRPGPSTLPSEATGDAELAATVRELAGPDRKALLAVVVTPDGTRTATIGAQPDTRFEIGSVSKAFTGLLLADAIERGEVTPETRLGDLLELGDAPAADVTLAQLATHTSGLPRLPIDLSTIPPRRGSRSRRRTPTARTSTSCSSRRGPRPSTPRRAPTPTSVSNCSVPPSVLPPAPATPTFSRSGSPVRWDSTRPAP
jgi:CubicO group peptidase (beta-lactamase class C family)